MRYDTLEPMDMEGLIVRLNALANNGALTNSQACVAGRYFKLATKRIPRDEVWIVRDLFKDMVQRNSFVNFGFSVIDFLKFIR